MASEKAANLAREKMSGALAGAGAHALEVAQVKRGARRTFAVIATFDKKPKGKIARQVMVTLGGRHVMVPIAVRIAPRFRPE